MLIMKSKMTTTEKVSAPTINPNYTRTNALVRKVVKYNFLSTIFKEDHFYFNNKVLLSPSRLLRVFNEYKYANVPKEVLKNAQNRGKRVMENLQYWFDNECHINEIPFLAGEREKVLPIFEWLVNNNAQVVAIEKFIHNGSYCGFIDMIIKMNNIFYIVEIKTRSKNEIYINDRLQTYIYSKLLDNCPRILMIIDSSNKIYVHHLLNKYDKRYFTNLKFFLKEYEVDLPAIEKIQIV